ncbi:MAG: ATP-binding protein [bacterium]
MKGYIGIIGGLVAVVLSLITLSHFFQRTLQMEMAEQFNKQQLLLANAEASNIQDYLSSIRDEVLHIAQAISMLQISKETDFSWVTDVLFKGNDSIGKRIEIRDGQGKTLFTRGSPASEARNVRTLIDRAKQLCPGDVLISQDTMKLSILAPVCRADSLLGTVSITLAIQDISKAFLSPIKSGSRGYAWMMDEKGNLLYHPTQPDMVGRNLYKTDSSCFACHKTFDAEKKIIEGKGDYYGRYVAPTGEDKILAFSTSLVGDSRWIIAVSAPYSEVTMSVRRSMKFYTWIIIVIFMTASGFSAVLIVLYRKKEKSEEREKHEEDLRRYAAELEDKVLLRTQELSTEKEKLDTIVTAIGSGIILHDMKGAVQWMNQTMNDIAGSDIIGMTWDEICAGCTVIASYKEREMQTEILLNLFRRNDRYFQVTTAPVRSGGSDSVRATIRLVQDVTAMKKMEDQMVHSEKLASLERLTAGIASEIGNPLTSVFSFIQVLMDMEEDEFKKETLETIFFHMNRISDILQQLSGFSKMLPLELKPYKINSIIEDILSLIQYDKRVQDITIMRELSPDIPVIITDRAQLSQVIVNIILNAADAMPNGGTLTIRSRVKDNNLVISFEDTGVGIDSEHLKRIFDPFYSTKEKGTGLGLAVSHSIITKLNGSLTAESELSKGSRFVITLPVNGTR